MINKIKRNSLKKITILKMDDKNCSSKKREQFQKPNVEYYREKALIKIIYAHIYVLFNTTVFKLKVLFKFKYY